MNKKIWDLYAPVYERAMRSDSRIYRRICKRISRVVKDMEVLELATGPGLIAKQVAPSTSRMVAADYSEGMIREPLFFLFQVFHRRDGAVTIVFEAGYCFVVLIKFIPVPGAESPFVPGLQKIIMD